MSAGRVRTTVPPASAGVRLDRFLGGLSEVVSRARGRQLIELGCVRVDGAARKPAFAVAAGMRVEVDIPPPEPAGVDAQDIPLTILHEDDTIVVVDKPAGMVVHPGAGTRRDTLVNALLHRYGTLSEGDPERPGIVHRLDKDTSGVIVVARTRGAHEHLARQFRRRAVEKRYLGLARGRVAKDEGEVSWPIGRHPRERMRMSVASRRARAASTAFRVLERLPGATLLELAPRTGRTHQLRVHLAALGHPLVGDRVYGRPRGLHRPPDAWAPVLAACPRQALHAASLAFAHPDDERPMRVEAPLPRDVARVIDELRALAAAKIA